MTVPNGLLRYPGVTKPFKVTRNQRSPVQVQNYITLAPSGHAPNISPAYQVDYDKKAGSTFETAGFRTKQAIEALVHLSSSIFIASIHRKVQQPASNDRSTPSPQCVLKTPQSLESLSPCPGLPKMETLRSQDIVHANAGRSRRTVDVRMSTDLVPLTMTPTHLKT